ncbi:MAG: recombinase family protein [Syntrophobacteraceae bacterium]
MPCDLPVKALRDLIALLDDLKATGVAFRSLTEAIDTETPTGRAMWHHQQQGGRASLKRQRPVSLTYYLRI